MKYLYIFLMFTLILLFPSCEKLHDSDEIVVNISIGENKRLAFQIEKVLNKSNDYMFEAGKNSLEFKENGNRLLIARISGNVLAIESQCKYKLVFENNNEIYGETIQKERLHKLKQ